MSDLPRLPQLEWANAEREATRHYLQDLLREVGYVRTRGHLRPTKDELTEGLDTLVRYLNRAGFVAPESHLGMQLLVRMILANFNQWWPAERTDPR